MDPKIWGPGAWRLLHSMAAVIETRQQATEFITFIKAFAKVIPCSVCQQHFAQNMQKHNIEEHVMVPYNINMFLWTWKMHDEVNKANGTRRPSPQEVAPMYFNIEGATPTDDNSTCTEVCEQICNSEVAELKQGSSQQQTAKKTSKFVPGNRRNRSRR